MFLAFITLIVMVSSTGEHLRKVFSERELDRWACLKQSFDEFWTNKEEIVSDDDMDDAPYNHKINFLNVFNCRKSKDTELTFKQTDVKLPPVITSAAQEIGSYSVYSADSIGQRKTMEDTSLIAEQDGHFLLAVFDGHGGDHVSKKAEQEFGKILFSSEEFKLKNYESALIQSFKEFDQKILASLSEFDLKNEDVGSCAILALVTPENDLFVANLGDSRALLGSPKELIEMSKDHKPYTEKERIEKAGGCILGNKVDGFLSVSRAFGNKWGKVDSGNGPIISCTPDIKHVKLSDSQYLLLASDGLFDYRRNQQIHNFVISRIVTGEIDSIASELIDFTLKITGVNPHDNISVIFVPILNGKSKDEWIQDFNSPK